MKLVGLTGFGGRRRGGGGIIGDDTELGSEAGIGNNRECHLTQEAPESGNVNSISMYVKSGNTDTHTNMKAVLRLWSNNQDSTGWPEDLLGVTEQVVIPSQNSEPNFLWYTFNFASSIAVTAGTIYSVGMLCSSSIRFKYALSQSSGDGLIFYYNLSTGVSYSTPVDLTVKSGNRYVDGTLSIYANYTT